MRAEPRPAKKRRPVRNPPFATISLEDGGTEFVESGSFSKRHKPDWKPSRYVLEIETTKQ